MHKKKLLKIFLLFIFSPFLLILLLSKFFLKIKIVEVETRAIGHYALPIEIFLCEVKNEIYGKNNVYLAFRNDYIANKFLYSKLKKNFIILPRFFLEPVFWFLNAKYIFSLIGKNFVSDYRHWRKNFNHKKPFQDVDIHDVLFRTPQNINFTKNEIDKGNELLKKMNLNQNSKFICFHSRTPHYHAYVRKRVEFRYDLRDTRFPYYAKTWQYFSKNNIKTLVFGDENKDFLIKNVIYYNENNIKDDFLDIFIASKCKYLVGDASGMSHVPLLFRKNILIKNVHDIRRLYTKDNRYCPYILLKKYKSLKTGEYLHYSEVLEKGLSEKILLRDLNDLGYDIEDNSDDEVLEACKEMDNFYLSKEFPEENKDLEKKFNQLLLNRDLEPLKHTKISYSFLRKNKFLIV
tara:strand:+ start:1872 stop:3083 length:1212 start_codon:yes stop_codon:yes gene_type:complete